MSAEFIAAVKKGDREAVEHMLAADSALVGAKDEHGVSAILLAHYYGKPEVAQVLLARKPTLDIFEAATAGDLDRARELLDKDKSLASAWSVDGYFPVGLAAFFKRPAVVKLLIESGADVRAASRPAGFTPLHSAVDDSEDTARDMVRWLLDAGGDPNARSASDSTPVHTAAFTGNIPVLQMLLAYGGDPTAVDNRGRTPLDLARERGNSEAAALLHHSVTNRKRT